MSRHCEQSLKGISNLSTIYFYKINLKAVGTLSNVQNKDKEDPRNFKQRLSFSSTNNIIPRQEEITNRTVLPLQST